MRRRRFLVGLPVLLASPVLGGQTYVRPHDSPRYAVGVGSLGRRLVGSVRVELPEPFYLALDREISERHERGHLVRSVPATLFHSSRIADLAHHVEETIGESWPAPQTAVVVAGLGGRTTAALAPLVVEELRARGAATSLVATVPFGFEGKRHRARADETLNRIQSRAQEVTLVHLGRMLPHARGRTFEGLLREADAWVVQAIGSRLA